MSEEVVKEASDAIQQHDSPATQEATVDAAAQAASVVDEGVTQDGRQADGAAPNEDEAHALEPDGKRFKQVWARAKTAEQAAEALKQELQREREERIRYEERLKAAEEAKKTPAVPEYTWEQLEGAIAEGKITRAQAQDYREKLVEQRAVEKARKEFEAKTTQTTTEATVLSELERYKQVVPELVQPGTPERNKVEKEYAFLTRLGYPPNFQTQLVAVRAAMGDVETVERTIQTKRQAQATKESYMETQSTGGRPQPKTKDPVASLTPERKAHYEKMIANGRYNGWEDVRKELEFVKPSLAPKRR